MLSNVEADGTPRIPTSYTDTHVLDVFARAIGRSGPPAVGAPNCTGGAVALAFAREGADVIINYLGVRRSLPMRPYG